MSLPKNFTDLATAYSSPADSFLNIIGVVVDLMPPTVTTKGQYMLTFKLLDERLRDSLYGNEGLRVRFFRPELQKLPNVHQHGDVVLLRNIKISTFHQQQIALSNFQTEVTVFPSASIPGPNFEIAYQGKQRLQSLGVPLDVNKLSLEEQQYVIALKREMGATVQGTAGSATTHRNNARPAPPLEAPTGPAAIVKYQGQDLSAPDPKRPKLGKKVKLISELEHMQFADIYAQVVKKFPTHLGTCELYVTDYTENKGMFLYTAPEEESDRERDGDTFGYSGAPKRSWPGPWGQLVLKINVRNPHADYANKEVSEGNFLLLKNVKIKSYDKLEGDMWPDDKNPGEVKINKLKDFQMSGISDILERRDKYWAARGTKLTEAEQQPEKKKPTKAGRKREKKQHETEQAAGVVGSGKPKTGKAVSGAQNGTFNSAAKADINPHLRCSHEEVPISSVKHVVDPTNERHTNKTREGTSYVLPFVNAKYRSRVRVVDYEPTQLEEFAVPDLPDDDNKSDTSQMMDYESSAKHEWSFSLQLEDASKPKASIAAEDRVWVEVMHAEAQYLFGNDMDDPKDLTTDQRLLSQLREKLWILWGDLEGKSDGEQISNRPFECCLAEYGVEMDDDDPEKASAPLGYKRMYSMFGVTIL